MGNPFKIYERSRRDLFVERKSTPRFVSAVGAACLSIRIVKYTGHRYAAQGKGENIGSTNRSPPTILSGQALRGSTNKLENDPMLKTGHSCGTES